MSKSTEKTLVITLENRQTIRYKAAIYERMWRVERVVPGWFVDGRHRIGEAATFEDAVTLARCHVDSAIRLMRIE